MDIEAGRAATAPAAAFRLPGCIPMLVIVILAAFTPFAVTAQNVQESGASSVDRLLRQLEESQLIRSQSNQFTVIVPPIRADLIRDPQKAVERNLLRLDGDLLVVVADRMSSSFYLFLGIPRQWAVPVFLKIDPTLEPDSDITALVRHSLDQTRIEAVLPYFISRERLARFLVNLVFREFLLQHPGRYDEDPPLWISRALERELLTGTLWRPMLEPGQRIHLNQQFVDSLVVSRKALDDQAPMSFEELSFPPPEAMAEELREYYDISAHIFLRMLAELPRGKSKLVSWLMDIKNHLNWQVGFMNAFADDFPTFLDLEKWWAIQSVKVFQRNELQMLQPSESLARLEQILIRYSGNEESGEGESGGGEKESSKDEVPMAQSLRSWLESTSFLEHQVSLRQALKQLIFLHGQSHPVVRDTIAGYANAVDAYLRHKSEAVAPGRLRNSQHQSTIAINRVINELEEADRLRLQTAARVGELEFGLVKEEPLIPNYGSRGLTPSSSADATPVLQKSPAPPGVR